MVVSLDRSVRALALKIATYGLAHFVVAAVVVFAITRDWRMATAVAVIEPFLQTIAYSFHDRLWHAIDRRRRQGRLEEAAEAFTARLDVMDAAEQSRAHGLDNAHRPSHRRVTVKTATYGLLHFAVSLSVAWVVTRDWRLTLAIGVIEPLVQMVVFTVHDRLWTGRAATRVRPA